MESLQDTTWDVLIAGTGLQQSLLALALSRSGKKVLHVDKNRFYGGADAALSADEFSAWERGLENGSGKIFTPSMQNHADENSARTLPKQSRSYALNVLPQFIYTKSKLLQALVASRIYTQLEFLVVGSWWVLHDERLQKIPNGREDVFADDQLSRHDKMGLMKLLRHLLQDSDDFTESENQEVDLSLRDKLTSGFRLPTALHAPILALATSTLSPQNTLWPMAAARIRRHLQSIGIFGPGFGAVLPKYGGKAEIAQVACRACAVGGGVYVLGTGVSAIYVDHAESPLNAAEGTIRLSSVTLTSGEVVRAKHIVGSVDDLPSTSWTRTPSEDADCVFVHRSISIISKPLSKLFPPTSENGPSPAVAVVLLFNEKTQETPVYYQVHSDDTEECPRGQCVIYASCVSSTEERPREMEQGLRSLVSAASPDSSVAEILWSTTYVAKLRRTGAAGPKTGPTGGANNVWCFPRPAHDLSVDDDVLDNVESIWRAIGGDDIGDEDFLRFERRENEEDAL